MGEFLRSFTPGVFCVACLSPFFRLLGRFIGEGPTRLLG